MAAFIDNWAANWSGGMHIIDGSPTLVNCLFSGNSIDVGLLSSEMNVTPPSQGGLSMVNYTSIQNLRPGGDFDNGPRVKVPCSDTAGSQYPRLRAGIEELRTTGGQPAT